MCFYDGVAYHEFEGFALDLDERDRLVRALGNKNVMILKNHGLLTVGSTVAEAFLNMYQLEQSCSIQVAAAHGGQKLNLPSAELAAHTAAQFKHNRYNQSPRPWTPLKRRLDRISPDYAS